MHADDIFRGIGKFAVKFRWVIVVLWLVAAAAIPKALPSLASVTQGNNSAFLPASAPSEHAANLAAPLGFSTSTVPIPVVAAVSTGSFSAADQAWLNGTLVPDLAKVKTDAEAIVEHAVHIAHLFPAGSTQSPTRARAAVWQNWSDFEKKAKALEAASRALAGIKVRGHN